VYSKLWQEHNTNIALIWGLNPSCPAACLAIMADVLNNEVAYCCVACYQPLTAMTGCFHKYNDSWATINFTTMPQASRAAMLLLLALLLLLQYPYIIWPISLVISCRLRYGRRLAELSVSHTRSVAWLSVSSRATVAVGIPRYYCG
jgi:hypothetical protein